MAKKITLNDIAAMLAKQGKEINDLTKSVGFIVENMATKADIARVQEQVNSIETELRYGRYETRLGNLEDKVFGAPRR